MNNALLVICPEQPTCPPPSIDGLSSVLHATGFAGPALNPHAGPLERMYMVGDSFLDHIAFLGCSPNIKLEPGVGHQSFCHVNIVSTSGNHIVFRSAEHTPAPRCPGCGKALNDWRSLAGNGSIEPGAEWQCHHCDLRAPPWQFNWRKRAGFGRCFIEISDIFPKEALPQAGLLDVLSAAFGMKWGWFYLY